MVGMKGGGRARSEILLVDRSRRFGRRADGKGGNLPNATTVARRKFGLPTKIKSAFPRRRLGVELVLYPVKSLNNSPLDFDGAAAAAYGDECAWAADDATGTSGAAGALLIAGLIAGENTVVARGFPKHG